MKNDLKFTTALAAALLASGCGNNRDDTDGWTARNNTAVCADRAGNRIADDGCRRGGAGGGGAHWLFLARNGVIPPYGEPVRGGSTLRAAGANYRTAPATTRVTRAGAISRGGFGASAHSFGGSRS